MTTPHPLATRLAQAEADLTAAESAHQTAADNLKGINAKLTQVEAAIATLSTQRLAGGATEQSATELTALTADRETLCAMRDEARAEVDALNPADIRATAQQVRFDWEQHCATERMAALVAKTKEIDTLLCRCIADIRATGQELHKTHLAEMWRPSRELHLIIGREFPPA